MICSQKYMTYMLRKEYLIEKNNSQTWVPNGDGTSTSQPDCNFISFDAWLVKNNFNVEYNFFVNLNR